MTPAFCSVVGAIVLGLPAGLPPAALRGPTREKFPPLHEEPSRPRDPVPAAPKQRIFGVGVGFEKSGTLSGVPISIVLADSPASRGGLTPGCIISEINGESTVGRPGDDCARLIRDGPTLVRLKFIDQALKEKTLTLEKEWLTVPE